MCLYLNTKVRTGTLLSLLVTAAMFSSQLGHSLPLTRSSKAPHIPLRAISIGMFDNSLHSRLYNSTSRSLSEVWTPLNGYTVLFCALKIQMHR